MNTQDLSLQIALKIVELEPDREDFNTDSKLDYKKILSFYKEVKSYVDSKEPRRISQPVQKPVRKRV